MFQERYMVETWNFPKTFYKEIYLKLGSLVFVAFTAFEPLKKFWPAGKNDLHPQGLIGLNQPSFWALQ